MTWNFLDFDTFDLIKIAYVLSQRQIRDLSVPRPARI
jgi:hypothetical protein